MLLQYTFMSGLAQASKLAEYMEMNAYCIDFLKAYRSKQISSLPSRPQYFSGLSHYCNAVEALNKLYSMSNPQQRRYLVQTVVGETGYVIGHNPESHYFMPEAYALRGRAQLLGKQMPQAEASLSKALQLDPQHVGAMHTLASLYVETNRKAKAVETVKAGVAIDPNHKGLRRLARELGIKVEDPKPAEPVQPPMQPAGKTPPVTDPAPPPSDPAKQAPSTPAATSMVSDGKAADAKDAPPSASPPTGTPTNPWCRFCPDPQSTDRPASTPPSVPKAAP
jgi:tetratricopeptide (TPR) repeat protein